MNFQKLKSNLYKFLPRFLRKKIKNFYYDCVLLFQGIKHKFYSGYFDFFEGVVIETTTYCNLRCSNCPNSKYEKSLLKNKKLIDENLFKKIIDDLAEYNFRGVIFPYFYGEPLSDERLLKFISYMRSKIPKSRINLGTNGFLLTIPLYKKLVESGVKNITITQYGKTMPPKIEEIFKYLKTRPKKENIISYRILNQDNFLSNIGGEVKVKKLLDEERPNCTYYNYVTINYKGEVILCCSDYHSSIVFGNVKGERLIDIWNKSRYKKIRKDVLKKIYRLPICRGCVGLE